MANFLAKNCRETSLSVGENLIYKSVASHPSHLADLDRIKEMGYKITTIYVTTESPARQVTFWESTKSYRKFAKKYWQGEVDCVK